MSAAQPQRQRPSTAGKRPSSASSSRTVPQPPPVTATKTAFGPSAAAVDHVEMIFSGSLVDALRGGSLGGAAGSSFAEAVAAISRDSTAEKLVDALVLAGRALQQVMEGENDKKAPPPPDPAVFFANGAVKCERGTLTGPWPQHDEGQRLVKVLTESRGKALSDLSLCKTQLQQERESLASEKRTSSGLRDELAKAKDAIMLRKLRLPPADAVPNPTGSGEAVPDKAASSTTAAVMARAKIALRPTILMEVSTPLAAALRANTSKGIDTAQLEAKDKGKKKSKKNIGDNDDEGEGNSEGSESARLQKTLNDARRQWRESEEKRRAAEGQQSSSGAVAMTPVVSSGVESSAIAGLTAQVENAANINRLQEEVIRSLEKEVSVLREQRDANLKESQSQLATMLNELEDAQSQMSENSAEWDAKQRELNRLRTLMRFSQLKRDSDKLHETYKRVDELESRMRKVQQAEYRDGVDRADLRRLRMLEAHCRSAVARARNGEDTECRVMDGTTGDSQSLQKWLSGVLPAHLLRLTEDGNVKPREKAPPAAPAALQQSTSRNEEKAADPPKRRRPTTANTQMKSSSSSLIGGKPPLTPRTLASLPSLDGDDERSGSASLGPSSVSSGASKGDSPTARNGNNGEEAGSSSPATKPVQEEAPPVVADKEVSYSVITQRMRDYLERKNMPQPPSKTPNNGNSEASQQRQAHQRSTHAKASSSAGFNGTRRVTRPSTAGARPSSSSSRDLRSASSSNRSSAADSAGTPTSKAGMVPRSFSFIGGRMIPIYNR